MKTVKTVTVDVDPYQLGFTQTHEHILCNAKLTHRIDPPKDVYMGGPMGLIDQNRAIDELKKYSKSGGKGIVEVTTQAWGRNLEKLKNISLKSGVHIIATAGFYTWPFIPKEYDNKSINDITKELVIELTEGIYKDKIRAGILKSAIHFDRIKGIEEKCLRAVARTSLETGAAITTHTSGKKHQEIPSGNVGKQHIKILKEEGVSLDRLVVGHTDEHPDINILSELASYGNYIQFDIIQKPYYVLDVTRAKLIKELIKRGYINKILISTDRVRNVELYKELGGVGYTYIHDVFLNLLRKEKITENEIEQICCINPGEMLAF